MLPWAEMLRAGLALGLSPAAVWALSLREWRWLAAGEAGLGTVELSRMMADHPDTAEMKGLDHDGV